MQFVILKSYDGGKRWERERRLPSFAAAAEKAYTLRTRHPMIRFRVDADVGQRAVSSSKTGPTRKG